MSNANPTNITNLTSKEAIATSLRSVLGLLRAQAPLVTLEAQIADILIEWETATVTGKYGELPAEGCIWGAMWKRIIWSPHEQASGMKVGAEYLENLAYTWDAFGAGFTLPPVIPLVKILGRREERQQEPLFRMINRPNKRITEAGLGDRLEVTEFGQEVLAIRGSLSVSFPKVVL